MCLNPLKVTVRPFLRKDGKKDLIVGYFQEELNEKTGDMAQHYLVPCGRCAECRSAKRKEWSERLMLEASLYPANQVYFITLTYDDEHISRCPLSYSGLRGLNYDDFRTFCYRIRDVVSRSSNLCGIELPEVSDRLRYFCALEYGDHSMRPHGHVVLFGLDLQSLSGNVPVSVTEEGTLFNSPLIGHLWPFGHNTVARASPGSLCYVAGYVTKKLGKRDDYDNLGISPERALMSTHPAIGVRFFEENKELIRETGCYVNPYNGTVHSIPRYALRTVFADDPGFVARCSHAKRVSMDNQLTREDVDRGERSEDARARVFAAKQSQIKLHRTL